MDTHRDPPVNQDDNVLLAFVLGLVAWAAWHGLIALLTTFPTSL